MMLQRQSVVFDPYRGEPDQKLEYLLGMTETAVRHMEFGDVLFSTIRRRDPQDQEKVAKYLALWLRSNLPIFAAINALPEL